MGRRAGVQLHSKRKATHTCSSVTQMAVRTPISPLGLVFFGDRYRGAQLLRGGACHKMLSPPRIHDRVPGKRGTVFRMEVDLEIVP